MKSLAERVAGRFIVFDGPDGAGKSTQLNRLHDMLVEAGMPVIRARDPGGTPIGDRIRHVLLDFDLSEMDVRCETLLFMASRAQLCGKVIAPALAAGTTVLCDRFVSATCAYQGAAGFDPRRVLEAARFAVDNTWPDVTLIVDVPPEMGFDRTGRQPTARRGAAQGQHMMFADAHTDAMESRPLEFHRRVRQLFAELPGFYPRPVAPVDGSGTPDAVHARVLDVLEKLLP